ncbi:MAG: hypothetical protein ACRD0E_03830 [Acidimicrobiales bacterium]
MTPGTVDVVAGGVVAAPGWVVVTPGAVDVVAGGLVVVSGWVVVTPGAVDVVAGAVVDPPGNCGGGNVDDGVSALLAGEVSEWTTAPAIPNPSRTRLKAANTPITPNPRFPGPLEDLA